MQYNHQLHPLEVNPKTGEPFLRLKQHPTIILTPPREEDAPLFVPLLNDNRISEWLGVEHDPYTLEHAKTWVHTVGTTAQKILQELKDASSKDQTDATITVGGCPVRFLREVKPDGTDVFIGDLGVMRCRHGEFMGADGDDEVDWERKSEREERNNSLPVGDPKIIWSMGNFLAPAYHGQGIMTDAIHTVLHDWCIPRMNVQRMWVSTFTGNAPSVRVFEKNGFKLIKTKEELKVFKGRMRGLNILEWKARVVVDSVGRELEVVANDGA